MTTNTTSSRFRDEYRRAMIAIPNREVELIYVMRAKDGDRVASNTLVCKYIPFLYKMAYQLKRVSYNLNPDEMVNAAILGFAKAIAGFDPTRGILFYTYYAGKAYNEMKKAAFDSLLVHRPENKLKSKDVNKESVMMESLDDVSPEGLSKIDRMKNDSRSEKKKKTHEAVSLANTFMKMLEGPEYSVMSGLFMLSDEPTTLRSVGMDMKISHERVRQLKNAALRRIRQSEKYMAIKEMA